ncbi:hypothetical protein TNCV_3228441 [Trichonephila clavipes]|nr:hypothetical protein TNCV_3228441 [Trichonephila clavipes]
MFDNLTMAHAEEGLSPTELSLLSSATLIDTHLGMIAGATFERDMTNGKTPEGNYIGISNLGEKKLIVQISYSLEI